MKEQTFPFNSICHKASMILAGQYNSNVSWHITTEHRVGYYKFTIVSNTHRKDAGVKGSKTLNKKFLEANLFTYGHDQGFVLPNDLDTFIRDAQLDIGDCFYIKPKGKKMEPLKEVLMRRDNLSDEEAEEVIQECVDAIMNGEELEEALLSYCGLGPDYIFDILERI